MSFTAIQIGKNVQLVLSGALIAFPGTPMQQISPYDDPQMQTYVDDAAASVSADQKSP